MKLKKILKLLIFFFGIVFLFILGLFIYIKITPKIEIKNANSIFMYDKENKIFFQGNGSSDWVSLEKISPYLINSTIYIEDKKFYKHFGFDFKRIAKSAFLNITNRKIVAGASTITQQYARNLFLNFDKTWKRKINEAFIAFKLESTYSKKEILEGYLNTINYGHGIYGIQNAARFYFNKNASSLSLAESSILAGIPNGPSIYSPITNYEASKKRQKLVLNTLYKNKKISKTDIDNAYNKKLDFFGKKDKQNLSTLMYYSDAVNKELKKINSIPKSYLETKGLKIYTTLDIKAQSILEKNIKKYITDENQIQIASSIIDSKTGKVLALVGGKDYNKSQYNRAIQAKRQVGSTMKTFLYYGALENGFTSATNFLSEKTTFVFGEEKLYSPQNYGNKYPNKPISLGAAISYSDNIFAVKTNLFLGPDVLVNVSKRMGIDAKLNAIPSLALGTEEINILDLTGGYSTLASGGYKNEPYLIEKIEDMSGKVLYKHKNKPELVLNPSLTFILNENLTNTYNPKYIDYNFPTCIMLAPKLSKKYAIKSGTTDNDILIVGYNPDITFGIWNGYDDNKFIKKGDTSNMKNIWAETIEEYLENKDSKWYDIPKNVVGVLVDPISGKPVSNDKGVIMYFLKGTEPYINKIDIEETFKTKKNNKN